MKLLDSIKNVGIQIIVFRVLFSCDISSIPRFVTDSLTHSLRPGAKLGQSYTTKGRPHIETWGPHQDIRDINDNDNNDDDVNNNKADNDNKGKTQLWDLIEARGFRKDIKNISNINDDDGDDDDDNNDEKNNTIPNQI